MATEIHAHAVLDLLREQPMSETELRELINSEFGEEVRFRTCKLSGFDLDSLLEFFVIREKVILSGGKWTVNAARVCRH